MKTRSNFNIIGVPISTITSGLVYNEQNQYNAEVAGTWPTVASTITPTVVSIVYANGTLAASTAGSETITINGFNFVNGISATINSVTVIVTYVNSKQLTIVTNKMPGDGVYNLVVTNPSSLSGTTSIVFSTPPIFYTSGSLGTFTPGSSISISIPVYSSPLETVTVTLNSGGLPSGVTVNSNTGSIVGTAPVITSSNSSSTYTFTLQVTNSNNQYTTQSFNISIITATTPSGPILPTSGTIIWINPLNNSTFNYYQYFPINNIQLNAYTYYGDTQTYSASGLPTGLSCSSTGLVSGTPTTPGTFTTTFTVTSSYNSVASSITVTFIIIAELVWATPASGSTISDSSYRQGIAMNAYTLSVTPTQLGDSTYTYSSSNLPSGLSISGNQIVGTPNTYGTLSVTVTTTSALTSGTTTNTFYMTILSPYITTSGGSPTTSGNYAIQTFTSSGTLTVSNAIASSVIEVLIVGGGGAGSYSGSGGGGAGGVLHGTLNITNGTYTVTVGLGGKGSGNGYPGAGAGVGATATGGNSSVVIGGTTYTAYGGGVGTAYGSPPTSGGSGGSGGGAGNNNTSSGSAHAQGGAATQTSQGSLTGYGNHGGQGGNIGNSPPYPAGGGGGAGAAGGDAPGSGGVGIVNPITGSTIGQNVSGTYYIAGGGGSGHDSIHQSGGYGGGGTGSTNIANSTGYPTAAQINTGGGGGGGSRQWWGSDGGSGVVIFRYQIS